MKRQSLVKGAFVLGIAGIIAKILGLFFRWPIIMLIGDEGVGYYQMSYPLYMFFIAVASGIPVAISKMVAERNAVGDIEGALKVFNRALVLMFMFGGGFTLFLLIFSKQLIIFFQWDNKAYYSLLGISLAPIFISIMSAFRGFFQGFQNMNPTGISQIVEQIGRVLVGVGLAYILLPKGIEYAAGGAAFGATAGGILGGIFLIFRYIKMRKEYHFRGAKGDSIILGKLLYIAIPISLGATVGTIMSLIDSFLVPQKLLQAGFSYKESAILYGQLTGKAFVLMNVPLTLSMALSVPLVPIVAEAFVLNKRNEVVNKIVLSLKMAAVIGLPCSFGLYFLAFPILQLIFPGHSDGYMILKYLSLSIPFVIVVQTTTSILQGVGTYIKPVINLFIGCVIKIILTFILVPMSNINIYGAVIGSICGYIVTSVMNLHLLKKTLKISINIYEIFIKPAYSSILMIIIVVIIYMYGYNYTGSIRVSCLVAILAGIVAYSIFILLLGTFKYDDIKKRIIKR